MICNLYFRREKSVIQIKRWLPQLPMQKYKCLILLNMNDVTVSFLYCNLPLTSFFKMLKNLPDIKEVPYFLEDRKNDIQMKKWATKVGNAK